MNAIVNFVTTIPIANIHPFEDNPYKVQDNEEMQFLCESIRENGVLSPLLVRKIGAAEEYEVISGHRRLYAAHKLGLTELPTVTTNLDRNAAAIALVDRLATSPATRFPIPAAAARCSGTVRNQRLYPVLLAGGSAEKAVSEPTESDCIGGELEVRA